MWFETIDEFMDAIDTGVLENDYTTTHWINRALARLCQQRSWPYRGEDEEINRELPLCDEFLHDLISEIQRMTQFNQTGRCPGNMDQRHRVSSQGDTAVRFLSQFFSSSPEIKLVD